MNDLILHGNVDNPETRAPSIYQGKIKSSITLAKYQHVKCTKRYMILADLLYFITNNTSEEIYSTCFHVQYLFPHEMQLIH